MKMNEYVEARRKYLGMTLEQLGELTGVGKSTVRKWEAGTIKNMKRDKVYLLAKALKVSPVLLLSDDIDISNVGIENISAVKKKKVPLIGTIAAGTPIYADEYVETYVDISEHQMRLVSKGPQKDHSYLYKIKIKI